MSYKLECSNGVKTDWCHKWCGTNAKLYEYVKGPLKAPMIAIPVPYFSEDNDKAGEHGCRQRLKECSTNRGIPDPWQEYLTAWRELEKGNYSKADISKRDIDITNFITQRYREYFGQGIPDPWKKWKLVDWERDEPSFEDLKKDFKDYLRNVKSGPGCDMFSAEKVSCPICDRKLVLLCPATAMSGSYPPQEAKVVKEKGQIAPVAKKPVKEKCMKDASVEAVEVPCVQREEEVCKTCKCKSVKVGRCENRNLCTSNPVCNPVKKGHKGKRCRSKRNEGTHCFSRDGPIMCDSTVNEWICGTPLEGSFHRNSRHAFSLPLRYSSLGQCDMHQECSSNSLPPLGEGFIDLRGGKQSILPFLYKANRCQCAPQQLIGFQEKNNPHLELQLICTKCERKRRKKMRKTKPKPAKENYHRREECAPCHCDKNKNSINNFPCFCDWKKPQVERADKETLYNRTTYVSTPIGKTHLFRVSLTKDNPTFQLEDHGDSLAHKLANKPEGRDSIKYCHMLGHLNHNSKDSYHHFKGNMKLRDSGSQTWLPPPKNNLTYQGSSQYNKYLQRIKNNGNSWGPQRTIKNNDWSWELDARLDNPLHETITKFDDRIPIKHATEEQASRRMPSTSEYSISELRGFRNTLRRQRMNIQLKKEPGFSSAECSKNELPSDAFPTSDMNKRPLSKMLRRFESVTASDSSGKEDEGRGTRGDLPSKIAADQRKISK